MQYSAELDVIFCTFFYPSHTSFHKTQNSRIQGKLGAKIPNIVSFSNRTYTFFLFDVPLKRKKKQNHFCQLLMFIISFNHLSTYFHTYFLMIVNCYSSRRMSFVFPENKPLNQSVLKYIPL